MPPINGHRLLCRVNELHDKVDELQTSVEVLTQAVTVAVDNLPKRLRKKASLKRKRGKGKSS